MATVTKDGYRSEKGDSFAKAVKVLTFILGLGVVIFALCYALATMQGCGSGSDTGAPVYQNGDCVNCSGNGDASVTQPDGTIYSPGDSCNGDTCVAKPDYVAPPCHVPTDPKIKEWCMPYWAQISKCFSTWEYHVLCGSPEDGLDGKDCYCYGEKAYDPKRNGAKLCDTVADCQQPIACEEWPPEVCQGLPCLLVGKWIWSPLSGGNISCADLSNIEFYDNGDGYCRVHFPPYEEGYPGEDFYYKSGDDHLQRPPSGPAENAYYLSEDGSQLKNSPDDTNPYERVTEEVWQFWCQ